MVKSSICNYSAVYIIGKGTIMVSNTAAKDVDVNSANKKVNLKNHTDRTKEITNTQTDITKDIDVIILTYKLIEYNDNHSK